MHPLACLRGCLADRRASGVRFSLAWMEARAEALMMIPRDQRDVWREVLAETQDGWRRAFEAKRRFGRCHDQEEGHMATNTAPSLSLTDKVYCVLAMDLGPGHPEPLSVLSRYPRTGDAGMTSFESECREWGFAYGVAFAIARSEDVWESIDRVTERALTAARDAFARWSGTGIFTPEAFDKDRAERERCAVVA